VGAILARHGVPLLRECHPLTGEVIRAAKTTAVRCEHDYPGSLVHMDVKKIGRIPDGGGWRALGRAQTDQQKSRRRIGFDYVHSMVDDYSRLAYSEVLPDEKGLICAGFAARALAHLAIHGSAEHQIRQVFIRPHCPWQNGKVERLNRTLQVEWAYRQVFTSNTARTQAPAPWLEHYNNQRRHSALGGNPPISRLS
jgi:transposase InsO family protein